MHESEFLWSNSWSWYQKYPGSYYYGIWTKFNFSQKSTSLPSGLKGSYFYGHNLNLDTWNRPCVKLGTEYNLSVFMNFEKESFNPPAASRLLFCRGKSRKIHNPHIMKLRITNFQPFQLFRRQMGSKIKKGVAKNGKV